MNDERQRPALVAIVTAFAIWGLSPLYFKAVAALPAEDIVAHRALWSALLLATVLALAGRIGGVRRQLAAHPGLAATLAATALLSGANWLAFVWAINAGRTLEASLGYFINPLFSMLLGALLLGERLRPAQRLAAAIAVAGVLLRVWQVGSMPWIALFLALTFGLYGLLRKRAPVDAVDGLLIESALLSVPALVWLGWQAQRGQIDTTAVIGLGLLLPMAGLITAVPLMLFAYGARRLPLTTVGFSQYLAPSLNFLLAVLVFHEPFESGRLAAFALIWLALAVYSADLWRASRQRARASGTLAG
ncbi:MAG: EamA family transporter RarD [Rhodocyclaceae bacterium]|nr:EamA family transporter RarD [Rhodocyclaceae bacterium]